MKLCMLGHVQAGTLSSVGGRSSEGMEGFAASLGFYPMGQAAQGQSGVSAGLPIFRVSWEHAVSISIRISHAPLLALGCAVLSER